jgi:hypothetical protein
VYNAKKPATKGDKQKLVWGTRENGAVNAVHAAQKRKPRWRGYPAAAGTLRLRRRRKMIRVGHSAYFHFSVFFRGAFGDSFSAKSVETVFGFSFCPPGKFLKPTLFTSGYSLPPISPDYLFRLPECFKLIGSGLFGPKPTSALAFWAAGLISGFCGFTTLFHLLFKKAKQGANLPASLF